MATKQGPFEVTEASYAVYSAPATEDKPLQRCAACKNILYCSKECQHADWKTHKKSCPGKSAKPSPNTPAHPSAPSASSGDMPLPVVLGLGPVMTVGEALAMKPGDKPPKFGEMMYYPSPKAVIGRCQEILGKHKKDTKNEKQNNKTGKETGEKEDEEDEEREEKDEGGEKEFDEMNA